MTASAALTLSYSPWEEPVSGSLAWKPLFESPLSFAPARESGLTSEYESAAIDEDFSAHFVKLTRIRRDPSLWVEGAPAPADRAFFWAKIVLHRLMADLLPPTRVVATAEGGIAIYFRKGDKYSDFECFNDGAILCTVSDRRSKPMVWEVDPVAGEIARASVRIRRFLQSQPTAPNAAKGAGA